MKKALKYGCLIVLALLLVACGPSAEEVAATYVAQTAAAATDTPVPTATNTPTLTPSPTLTPTIEPQSQLSALLQNARFTFYDNFDFADAENWKTQACQTVSNGELEYACPADGFMSRDYTFHEGEGILIDFKSIEQEKDVYWGINFGLGDFGEDNWRNFGVSESVNKYLLSILKGDTWLGSDIYWIKPDVWYTLALAVGTDGRILVAAWERDDPNATPWKYRNTLGKGWAELEWYFWVNNADKPVTLYFDNFYIVEFDAIN